jgi:hypothetical protein
MGTRPSSAPNLSARTRPNRSGLLADVIDIRNGWRYPAWQWRHGSDRPLGLLHTTRRTDHQEHEGCLRPRMASQQRNWLNTRSNTVRYARFVSVPWPLNVQPGLLRRLARALRGLLLRLLIRCSQPNATTYQTSIPTVRGCPEARIRLNGQSFRVFPPDASKDLRRA